LLNAARPGVLLGAPGLACGSCNRKGHPGSWPLRFTARPTSRSHHRHKPAMHSSFVRWQERYMEGSVSRVRVSGRRVAASASMTHGSQVGSPKIQDSFGPTRPC